MKPRSFASASLVAASFAVAACFAAAADTPGLDPKEVKVGDKVKIVVKEINQRSGALVFAASKAAYGTVRSVAKVEFNGKENIVFELAPYGSDGKAVLKYDRETGQTTRVEPTIRFGTLNIVRIEAMPPDDEMAKIAAYRDTGIGSDEVDSAVLALGEDRVAVERRVRSLEGEIVAVKQAIADHEAAGRSTTKPAVAMLRDKTSGTTQVDSAASSTAQEIADDRRNAEAAAVIRLKARLAQKEDDLREEMAKLADYGETGIGSDDLSLMSPGERKVLLDNKAKVLGEQIRSLRQAVADHEAAGRSATKPAVAMLRDKTSGTTQVDSAASSTAQEIADDRRNAEAAAVIRLKARLEQKEAELKMVKEQMGK